MKTLSIPFFIFLFTFFSSLKAQTLIFKYDSGGNQIIREYCGSCSNINKNTKSEALPDVIARNEKPYDVKVYPNPTKDFVTLAWSKDLDMLISKIEYVAYNFTQYREIKFKRGDHKTTIDFRKEPIGLYVVIFHLTNGENLTYKILKN